MEVFRFNTPVFYKESSRRWVLIFKLNGRPFSDYIDQMVGFSDWFNRDYVRES